MAEIVLINPRPGGKGLNEATIEPPLGLAYIASWLRDSGFTCSIIDANVLDLSAHEAVSSITEETLLVGISVNSFSVTASAEIAALVRSRNSATIIIGGPFPTAAPEKALSLIPADAVIMGEGEYPVREIVRYLARGADPFSAEIPGVVPRSREVGAAFPRNVRIDDLDALPFPAYDLLPPLSKYRTRARKSPSAALVTSRGCAYGCSFCSKDVFQRKVSYRSAENVLAEIDLLTGKFGARQLDILDDNFLQNRKRLEVIMEGIIRRNYRIVINLQTGVRTEMLDEEMLRTMKRAGVFKIAFGIESGDEDLLCMHRKDLDLARVESVVKIAKRLGFIVYGFFIIGLLGETEQGFRKTLAFANKLDLDIANFCMAIPFPGTELYQMVADQGRFLIDTTGNIDSGFYDGRVFYVYEGCSEEEILARYRRAYQEYYSLKRRGKMIMSIRSLSELAWHWNAFSSVAKGSSRDQRR